jgi:hypothetical protein
MLFSQTSFAQIRRAKNRQFTEYREWSILLVELFGKTVSYLESWMSDDVRYNACRPVMLLENGDALAPLMLRMINNSSISPLL